MLKYMYLMYLNNDHFVQKGKLCSMKWCKTVEKRIHINLFIKL